MNYEHCQAIGSDATQHELIQYALNMDGRTWKDVVKCTLTEEQLSLPLPRHCFTWAFTVWTVDRVYFPGTYDSSHFVASVPRYPCDEKTEEVGG